jgi:hypothetical protein
MSNRNALCRHDAAWWQNRASAIGALLSGPFQQDGIGLAFEVCVLHSHNIFRGFALAQTHEHGALEILIRKPSHR